VEPKALDARVVVKRPGFHLDVGLHVDAGETVALLGPNGAGKSTTLDALAGLEPLFHGHITLDGRVLDSPRSGIFVPPRDRQLGVVFQDYLLFSHLSITDNVAFPLVARGVPRRSARRSVADLLDEFDLSPLANRYPHELSGGQAQRVALARALASAPKMLLLDEPFAALDIESRAETRAKLASQVKAFDGPRVFITHDPTDAFMLADRILIIERGRLVQAGTADDVRQRPATAFVAAFAGTNVFRGRCATGAVNIDGHRHTLQVADQSLDGDVIVRISPSAVALHRTEPGGSPRNTWATTIEGVENLGDTVRVSLAGPLPLVVDVTAAAVAALGLGPLTPVWATVKATEIEVLTA